MIDWEWYDDHTVQIVFIYLLLTTNHKDVVWHGMAINSGSTLTSINKLATSTKFSGMQIRNALNKLKSTGEITIKTTNKYSLITINNYADYQQDNTQDNKQTTSKVTDKQQANNKQSNNKQEEKNEKNEKKEYLPADDVSASATAKQEFGNKYINEIIEYLKVQSRLPALDETKENNRKYAYLLLNKYREPNEVDFELSLKRIKMLINYLSLDKFWRPKVTSVVKLHKFSVTIYAQMEEKNASQRVSS